MTIPRHIIIQSFFWPGRPDQLALFLSHWYRQNLSAARLRDIWIEESEINPLLQVDRPRNGFPQNGETRFKERLAAPTLRRVAA